MIQDWYGYRALKNKQSMPKPVHNPKLSDLVDQIVTADSVNADTELLIHFVGHSISVGEDDIDLILGMNKKGGDDRYLERGARSAFDASFSDGVLSALELDIKKNDQRIDRQADGITYMKIFEDARRKVIGTNSTKKPQYYGDYGDELIKTRSDCDSGSIQPFCVKQERIWTRLSPSSNHQT